MTVLHDWSVHTWHLHYGQCHLHLLMHITLLIALHPLNTFLRKMP